MTATTPQPMEGTEAPNQIEYLYERYRHLIKWVLVLLIVGLGINEFLNWQHRSQVDETWSRFAVTIGLDESYTNKKEVARSLTDHIADVDLADLEAARDQVTPEQKPFLLLAIARRAMIARDWDRAESTLKEIETSYPEHSLVVETDYPVQVRALVKEDKEEVKKKPNKKPEYEPAVAGSMVGMMRAEIEAEKNYQRPQQFEKIEPPADAPRVKFEFVEGYGSITIALMEKQAPLHCAKFLELAREGFWVGLNVDEIQRASTGFWKYPMEFHLGYTTTKEADRSKWTKTDPSENQVDYEDSGLSHFPGAVSARPEAKGMSCADRFYVCAEDNASQDGQRVVFGYVVEGLENVKTICEAAMTAQEEEAGRGTPTDNITVTKVTVLE